MQWTWCEQNQPSVYGRGGTPSMELKGALVLLLFLEGAALSLPAHTQKQLQSLARCCWSCSQWPCWSWTQLRGWMKVCKNGQELGAMTFIRDWRKLQIGRRRKGDTKKDGTAQFSWLDKGCCVLIASHVLILYFKYNWNTLKNFNHRRQSFVILERSSWLCCEECTRRWQD